jgi:S-adenosylmethionine:tRNA ribosyltransferase-isomerase
VFALADYDYELPEALIAQKPAAERDRARLLRVERATGRISHHRFDAIGDLLAPGDLLVANDTAVVPARLLGRKESGGQVEVLLVDYAGGRSDGGRFCCACLIKSSKPVRAGTRIRFEDGLVGEVTERGEEGWQVVFSGGGDARDLLERVGHVPLPPYIRRADAPADRQAYQTVYAARRGAAAAPTAGLHFTERLLAALGARGIRMAFLTLHVGYGTFAPVRTEDIRRHRMHAERFTLPQATAEAVAAAKREGRRVVAVGTTVVRTLEAAAGADGRVAAGSGLCDLFIYPGYRFKAVDAMITNFHLPKSTLLMLVSAFAGRDFILSAYREAVRRGYRFFSYGDAMVVL